MNQFFDTQRWALLIRKHWGENRKTMILSAIAIASLMMIWYLLFLLVNRFRSLDEMVQLITYYFGLFLGGCLYASLLFSELSTRPKGINFILVPASSFEKLLCALVYGILLFFVAYTLIFYVVDIPIVKLANSIAASKEGREGAGIFVPQKVVNIFRGPSDRGFADIHQSSYFLLMFFAIQSAFVLGSIYAPKFSFIKTSILLLLLFVFAALVIGQLVGSLLPEGYFYENITTYRLTGSEGDRLIKLPQWVHDIVIFLFQYSFAPIFWVATYFRLKEKQI